MLLERFFELPCTPFYHNLSSGRWR